MAYILFIFLYNLSKITIQNKHYQVLDKTWKGALT